MNINKVELDAYLDKNNPIFWKNQILNKIEEAKESLEKRPNQNEDKIISDLLYSIQHIAIQAGIYSVNLKNKETLSNKKDKSKIKHYQNIEKTRGQIKQSCRRSLKKRSIKNITNGDLFKLLISQPENNIFEYQAKTSKKIYDVIVLKKTNKGKKTDYQLEILGNKNTVFTVSVDKGQEQSIFKLSKDTSVLKGIQEIEETIAPHLNKIF